MTPSADQYKRSANLLARPSDCRASLLARSQPRAFRPQHAKVQGTFSGSNTPVTKRPGEFYCFVISDFLFFFIFSSWCGCALARFLVRCVHGLPCPRIQGRMQMFEHIMKIEVPQPRWYFYRKLKRNAAFFLDQKRSAFAL